MFQVYIKRDNVYIIRHAAWLWRGLLHPIASRQAEAVDKHQREHDQQGDDVATGSWHGRVAPSGCKAFETESLAVFAPVRAGQSRLWPLTVMRNLQSRPSAARRHIIIRVRKISKYSRMSDTAVSIWSSRVMVRSVASTRTKEWVAE